MEKELTFDSLPRAVNQLSEQVTELKQLLLGQQSFSSETKRDPDKLLIIEEAAEILRLSVATIYSKVSKGELPYMKRGKRLYFMRDELIAYLKRGRVKANPEIEQEAIEFVRKTKGGQS